MATRAMMANNDQRPSRTSASCRCDGLRRTGCCAEAPAPSSSSGAGAGSGKGPGGSTSDRTPAGGSAEAAAARANSGTAPGAACRASPDAVSAASISEGVARGDSPGVIAPSAASLSEGASCAGSSAPDRGFCCLAFGGCRLHRLSRCYHGSWRFDVEECRLRRLSRGHRGVCRFDLKGGDLCRLCGCHRGFSQLHRLQSFAPQRISGRDSQCIRSGGNNRFRSHDAEAGNTHSPRSGGAQPVWQPTAGASPAPAARATFGMLMPAMTGSTALARGTIRRYRCRGFARERVHRCRRHGFAPRTAKSYRLRGFTRRCTSRRERRCFFK